MKRFKKMRNDYSIESQAWIQGPLEKGRVVHDEWDKAQEKKAREFLRSYSPKIQNAFEIANRLHASERRKLTHAPYIVHPFGVFKILTRYTKDEETLCAALLHDTIENVKTYSVEALQNDIGNRVAEIVLDVSEKRQPHESRDKKATWRERKLSYLEKLQNDPEQALMICAADKIDNLKSIIVGYEKMGELVWKNFNAKEEDMIWFYEQVLTILKRRLDNPIVKELERMLKKLNIDRAARKN